MPLITSTTLDRALALLGELLAARKHPAQHFVVCGGSSLLALNLVRRTTTQDVDVLAKFDADKLVADKQFLEKMRVSTSRQWLVRLWQRFLW